VSKPDPFVFIGGGPGAWNLEGYLPTHAVTVLAPINEERDVVFFDQRGNGLSSSSLACPEYTEIAPQRYALILDNVEDAEALLPPIQDCYTRLSGEGINLSNFSSYQVASDIAALLSALRYESYNLYGISYGGHQAQIMMRDHPERIRSVIIDSSSMPEIDTNVTLGASFERSLDLLFDACSASSTCANSNPGVKDKLVGLVKSLDEVPHYSPIYQADGKVLDVYITGGRLLGGLHSALYQANLLPLLPSVITATAAGNMSLLDAFVPQIALPDSLDQGLFYSVHCNETIPFVVEGSVEDSLQQLDPNLGAVRLEFNTALMFGACDLWHVTPRPPIAVESVKSDIPTLILSGEFDPISPPTQWGKAQENLTKGQFFVFSGISHGVLRSNTANGDELSCAGQIVMDFLGDPLVSVDGSCAEELPGPFG
jgi:pimeloyl-ACP methyl ester carboxylesterase